MGSDQAGQDKSKLSTARAESKRERQATPAGNVQRVAQKTVGDPKARFQIATPKLKSTIEEAAKAQKERRKQGKKPVIALRDIGEPCAVIAPNEGIIFPGGFTPLLEEIQDVIRQGGVPDMAMGFPSFYKEDSKAILYETDAVKEFVNDKKSVTLASDQYPGNPNRLYQVRSKQVAALLQLGIMPKMHDKDLGNIRDFTPSEMTIRLHAPVKKQITWTLEQARNLGISRVHFEMDAREGLSFSDKKRNGYQALIDKFVQDTDSGDARHAWIDFQEVQNVKDPKGRITPTLRVVATVGDAPHTSVYEQEAKWAAARAPSPQLQAGQIRSILKGGLEYQKQAASEGDLSAERSSPMSSDGDSEQSAQSEGGKPKKKAVSLREPRFLEQRFTPERYDVEEEELLSSSSKKPH